MGSPFLFQFSIIITTFHDQEMIQRCLLALERLNFEYAFEVLVLTIPSITLTNNNFTDSERSFPLRLINCAEKNFSTARNRGVKQATGKYLLFLDGNMEADSQLLLEHNRSFQKGAEVVLGQIHTESTANVPCTENEKWALAKKKGLPTSEVDFKFYDIRINHLAIKRITFNQIGGFESTLSENGNSDYDSFDFGIRLLNSNVKIHFNPNAITLNRPPIDPSRYLNLCRQSGRAAIALARKYPDLLPEIVALHPKESLVERLIWRWIRVPLKKLILYSFKNQPTKSPKAYSWLPKLAVLEFHKGMREKGGIPKVRPLRILCYHAVADLKEDELLSEYGTPPRQFRQQIETLSKYGFNFISTREFLYFFEGKGGLPRKPVLLTFDDGYRDLLTDALPILEEKQIPGIVFVVSRLFGDLNRWDAALGAKELRLLTKEEIKELNTRGITIGAHSQTHPDLTSLPIEKMTKEVTGSINDLKSLGFLSPLLFAYPYGLYNQRVIHTIRQCNVAAGFTVIPGMVLPKENRYEIPRIEIFRQDAIGRFLLKVWLAGSIKKYLNFHFHQIRKIAKPIHPH